MNQLKDKIVASISAIDQTTDYFYQNNPNKGFAELDTTIVILSQAINEIYVYNQQQKNQQINDKEILGVLSEAMKAMETKDMILLADILQYDLKVLLKEAQKTIK